MHIRPGRPGAPHGSGVEYRFAYIKLFIGFIFSVANNLSLRLKGETDSTDADSNEKRN